MSCWRVGVSVVHSLMGGLGLLALILLWHGVAFCFGMWVWAALFSGVFTVGFQLFLLMLTMVLMIHFALGLPPFRWVLVWMIAREERRRERHG